jgi:high-affinity iron transporter
MIPGFLIALREGLEAALIVGLTLGVLTKIDRRGYHTAVWSGVAAAAFISLGVAGLLHLLGTNFEEEAEKVFEGVTMIIAAGVLTWMIFWMRGQSLQLQQRLEGDVRLAVERGQKVVLFGIAFFAVLREGIETALFLTANALSTSAPQTFIGGLIGLVTAGFLGWAIFATTVRLDVRRFFQVTSVILILFAAGLFAHGIHEFIEAGWIPAIIDPLWDINHILSEDSGMGTLFKALFGYNGDPSLSEVLAYIGYYLLILLGARRLSRTRPEWARATEQPE